MKLVREYPWTCRYLVLMVTLAVILEAVQTLR
jgi:hypothetical protein